MTDLALKPFSNPLDGTTWFDVAIDDVDLAADDGLETAVTLSLCCDARQADERGWWGNLIDDAPSVGSLLWTLDRSKTTPEVLRVAQEAADAALAWLVNQGIAQSVQVQASRQHDRLLLDIRIQRGNGDTWQRVWDAQDPAKLVRF